METDTYDRLVLEMTMHRFRHMPVVEMGRLIGIVSIGDLVKTHVADAEFASGAIRHHRSRRGFLTRHAGWPFKAGDA